MPTSAITGRTYTTKELIMYLLGMTGQNMIYNVIATGLYFYFQSVIFIPAIAISIIFAVARVWDAINDPMMGTIVDKTRSKYGKCRPYLMYVPSVVFVITILGFVNDIYSSNNSQARNVIIVAWAAVSYILWGMSYTVGDIPIWGIASLMTENEKDRSKVLSLARIVASIGAGIVVVSIIPVSQAVGIKIESVVGEYRSQQFGFIIVAIVLTIIGTLLFQCASYAKERVEKTDATPSFKENIKTMVSCKPFFRILLSGVLRSPIMLLSNIAFTVLAYYYGNYYDNYMLYMVILGGGLFGGQFIAMIIVPIMANKTEKKRLYNICSIGGAIPFVAIYILYKAMPQTMDTKPALIISFFVFLFAGVSIGALNVLQSIMIADSVDYEEYENNRRPDGIFFSGQSFITKLSSGISSLISGLVFAAVGFSGEGVAKINAALKAGTAFKDAYPKIAAAMFFVISVPPAIGLILSAIPMFKYELTNEKHSQILESLIKKRKSLSDSQEEE